MSQPGSDPSGLPPLQSAHAAMELRPYLSDLWARREYVWVESVSELRARQITNVLGNLWHLLNPALNITIYFLIFGLLLGVDRGVDNFILFLSTGLFIHQLTQRTTTSGAKSIVGNRGLLQAIKFPRALLPITSSVTEFLAASSTFGIVFVVALLTGESPRWSWLMLAPLLVVQSVFNLGAALFAARLTTHFVDLTNILPFAFRLVLYGSGVIFNVSEYVESDSWIRWLFTLNPVYCYITVGRWAVMGTDLSAGVVISGSVWAIAMFVFGFVYFRAGEERYASV
ncbi:MAG: ABC transporter permease [Actinomycetota bacterium]